MRHKNNILIILGMHRSGTSVAAQWLHACGLHLGDRLIGSSVGNDKGHYEDLDFHDLHEEVFRANRVPYGGLKRIYQLNISNDQKLKFKGLVERKNSRHKTWGFKDPRTCLLTDIYEDLIDSATYLVIHREANEVVNSLLKRLKNMAPVGYHNGGIIDRLKFQFKTNMKLSFSTIKTEKDYTESWIQYNQSILHFLDNLDKHRYKVVRYTSLLQNSKHVISWLNNRHFNLKNKLFEEIFDSSMISSGDSIFRISEEFIDRVTEIEYQFSKLEDLI